MSIPYGDHLQWDKLMSPVIAEPPIWAPSSHQSQKVRAKQELTRKAISQIFSRSVQFIRDAARLVLKVPVRSIWTPIILPKNWKQRERAKINAKLAGYSFVQLVILPAKFAVALVALALCKVDSKRAKLWLDESEEVTAYLDGRASQLEALKEEGRVKAQNFADFEKYRTRLYKLDPKVCVKN